MASIPTNHIHFKMWQHLNFAEREWKFRCKTLVISSVYSMHSSKNSGMCLFMFLTLLTLRMFNMYHRKIRYAIDLSAYGGHLVAKITKSKNSQPTFFRRLLRPAYHFKLNVCFCCSINVSNNLPIKY